jgi:surfeit locus 1 family protein
VTVDGTWGPAADQLFITDRRQGSQDGLWVISPVMLTSPGASTSPAPGVSTPGPIASPSPQGSTPAGTSTPGAVMVVRGWVSSVSDPAARAPSGPVRLSGAVTASEAQDSSGDANGRVLQSLRIPTIVHMVDYRIYDAFVVQASIDSGTTPQPAPAVVPAPAPPTDHAGLRNVAYAFQWWIFAAFTLWMWTRMVLDARRPDSSDSSGPSGGDPDRLADQAGEPVESSGTVSA